MGRGVPTTNADGAMVFSVPALTTEDDVTSSSAMTTTREAKRVDD